MCDQLSGIYIIRNIANGKLFVGMAEDFRKRKAEYLGALRRGNMKNPAMQEDFNLFGENEFEIELIEACGKEEMGGRKRFWIDHFGSDNKMMGYNKPPARPVMPESVTIFGEKRKKETKKRLRRGKKVSDRLYLLSQETVPARR